MHLHRNHSPEPNRVYKETRTSIERDQKNEQLAKQFPVSQLGLFWGYWGTHTICGFLKAIIHQSQG